MRGLGELSQGTFGLESGTAHFCPYYYYYYYYHYYYYYYYYYYLLLVYPRCKGSSSALKLR